MEIRVFLGNVPDRTERKKPSWIMVTLVLPISLIISTSMLHGLASLPNFILETAFVTISMVIEMGSSSSGGFIRQMLRVLFNFHIRQPFIMF